MDDCIFCKIAKGEIPSYKIYEDDKTLAFLDIRPYTEGHTLVVPKNHYRWMWDLPENEVGDFMKVCLKLGRHYQKTTGNEVVFSMTLGTDVPHLHYHIIPNVEGKFGEELGEAINKSRLDLSKDKLQEIQEKLTL